MAIDFPNTPSVNQLFSVGDRTWQWNGTAWVAASSAAYATLTGVQTLTNKTLTAPTITTSIVAGSASMDIFNTTATTVNAFGAATALNVGGTSSVTTINGNEVVYNAKQVNEYGGKYRASITSGTSWTSPAGINTVTFVVVGAGGGGGGCFATSTNTKSAGGGGAAGKIAVYKNVPIDPSTAYTLSLGTAGTAGAATPTAGGNGGSTTITVTKTISSSGTIASSTSFQCSITGLSSTLGLSAGMEIIWTAGTGSSSTNTGTVIEVTSSTAIKVNTLSPVNGSITNIRNRNVLTAAGGTGGSSITNGGGSGGAGGTMRVYDYYDFIDSFSIATVSGLNGYQETATLGAGASGSTAATSPVSPTNPYPSVFGTPLSATYHHLSPSAGNGGYGPTSPSVVAGATVTSTLYGFGGNGGSIQSPGGAQGAAGSAGVAGAIYVFY